TFSYLRAASGFSFRSFAFCSHYQHLVKTLPLSSSVCMKMQELGNEKIQLASQMVEMLENLSRQVDCLTELLETRHEPQESMTATTISSVIPSKRREEEKRREKSIGSIEGCQKNIDTQKNVSIVHHDEGTGGIVREKQNKTSKKKKRSKAKADRKPSPTDLLIDPNETTYCLFEQVSFGEMVGCDNYKCQIEWFQFSFVGLNHKPKGKWYCPKCTGETEKTMHKALEKAKKERAFNR
uniref:Inhibitor of growth family member 1 n=2 Tax=Cyprinus carpio TaxID=7962 RepID=A0A8C1E8M0_CYPCA